MNKKIIIPIMMIFIFTSFVNADTLTYGYITFNGANATEYLNFKQFTFNNSIQNFTRISIDKDVINLTDYDALVDLYILSHNSELDLVLVPQLKEVTKGILHLSNQYISSTGLLYCNKSVSTYINNNLNFSYVNLPVYNSSNGFVLGNNAVTGFKDGIYCNYSTVNFNLNKFPAQELSRDAVSGLSVESNVSILNNYTTKSRHSMFYTKDNTFSDWTELTRNASIHAMVWVSENVSIPTPPTPNASNISNTCDGYNFTYLGDAQFIEFCDRPSTFAYTRNRTIHDIVTINPTDCTGESCLGGGASMSMDYTYKGSPFYVDSNGIIRSGIGAFYHTSKGSPGHMILTKGFEFGQVDSSYSYYNGIKWEEDSTVDDEGYCHFINEYTILCIIALSNSQGSAYNKTAETDISTTNDEWSAYTDTIDGLYTGLRIFANESCTGWCDDIYRYKFILAVNNTPNISIVADDINWNFEIGAGEKEIFTFVLTADFYENNVSDWLSNPYLYFNRTRNESKEWINKFFYPKTMCEANEDWCFSYYRNVMGYNMNWQCPFINSTWQNNVSYFNQDQCYWSASKTKYHGIWTSDTSRLVEDVLRATNDTEILKMGKIQIEIFTENMNTDHYRSDIRDTYLGTSLQSPLMPCTILQIYQKDNNLSWLESVYSGAENDTDWRYANRRDSNGLYYCGGLECGDGRGTDIIAPDVNAEMHWLYRCMQEISSELNFKNDTIKWQSKGTFLDGYIDDFFKDCQGNGAIFTDLTKDSLQCVNTRNDSTGFGFKLLWSNHSEINSTMVSAHLSAINNASRYNHTFGGIPDISFSDDDWTNASIGMWWTGNRWSILSQFASFGFNYMNETKTASRLRNETINLISEVSTGTEWFSKNSTNHGGGGNIELYGWTMGNILSLMNTEDYFTMPALRSSNVSASYTSFSISSSTLQQNQTLTITQTIDNGTETLDQIWFTLNTTRLNTTAASNGTNIIYWDAINGAGTYNITGHVNTSTGKIYNSTIETFTITIPIPVNISFTSFSLSPNPIIQNNTITVTAILDNGSFTLDKFWILINSTPFNITPAQDGTNTIYFDATQTLGSYNITGYINDTNGNTVQSSTIVLTISDSTTTTTQNTHEDMVSELDDNTQKYFLFISAMLVVFIIIVVYFAFKSGNVTAMIIATIAVITLIVIIGIAARITFFINNTF